MPDTVHTKNRILAAALGLFSSLGYENVSMRAIADEVGIKASSIYNHYPGKVQILDACYDFYLEHRYDARPTPLQYAPVLLSGTKEEILAMLYYPFHQDTLIPTYQAFLILFSRIYTDERAKDIYTDEVEKALKYLNKFFKKGIEVGRIAPFDVHVVSMICMSARLFTAQLSVMSPSKREPLRYTETAVFSELKKLIPFLY